MNLHPSGSFVLLADGGRAGAIRIHRVVALNRHCMADGPAIRIRDAPRYMALAIKDPGTNHCGGSPCGPSGSVNSVPAADAFDSAADLCFHRQDGDESDNKPDN